MGGGNSKSDGIEGVRPYWVHIGAVEALKAEHEVPMAEDFEFDCYVVTEWIDDHGKTIRNSRGTSAFTRHGNYRKASHTHGAVFNEIMDFNVMHTQLCRLKFALCERKDGVNGMWDHTFPLAVAETSKSLMDIVKEGMLGKPQTVDFIANDPKYARIGMRMTYTIGDVDFPKPVTQSEALKDMGNGPVELLKDENGDGQIDGADAGVETKKIERPKLLSHNTADLTRTALVPKNSDHVEDDV